MSNIAFSCSWSSYLPPSLLLLLPKRTTRNCNCQQQLSWRFAVKAVDAAVYDADGGVKTKTMTVEARRLRWCCCHDSMSSSVSCPAAVAQQHSYRVPRHAASHSVVSSVAAARRWNDTCRKCTRRRDSRSCGPSASLGGHDCDIERSWILCDRMARGFPMIAGEAAAGVVDADGDQSSWRGCIDAVWCAKTEREVWATH